MSKPIRSDYNHKITHDPEPEDAGTIRINARIFREYDILTYTTLSFPDELINDECQSKVDLIHLLKEAGLSDYGTAHMMYHFIGYVAEITSSASEGYSPGCALEVSLDLLLIDESHIGEAVKVSVEYEIKQDLEPEDAGTIRVNALIISEDDILTFTTLSFANEFINDDRDECRSKVDLKDFLKEAGTSDYSIALAMYQIDYVAQITSSASNGYSPGCALQISLNFDPHDEPHIEEAAQLSFDETTNISLGPASKLVVKSLIRKIYDKINYTGERCTICLEEFNNGGRLVALPCGHDFDDECAVKWFETNHVCPLCRYELPCEEDQ
ncbi:Zinc finger RING-type [Arabidopsis suecica]|uniref:RING-type E3 ubiquitin transferase n=1 Tax=Arabidopsis suecica TaxID=45249 RepID=A0A8T2B859_ARASU|nr:Zinc finger RING-type [Arabidopsis suecica]